MKETRNGVLSHSDVYYKETDSLSVNMKNLQHFSHLGKETDNSVLLKREGDGFWTSSELEPSKIVNHVIKDTESGGRRSLNEPGLGEVLYNQLGTKGSKILTSDVENSNKFLNGPEFERVMAPDDCANRDEHELPQIITSKLFQADFTLYTDKSVMECKVPPLSICCKDIDCQHVKDICVDKGEPLEEKRLIDKHTDSFMGPNVSKPSNGYETNDTTRNLGNEFHIPDGLTSPAHAHANFSDLTVDRYEAKERKIISPRLNDSECHSAGNVKENGPNSEAFMQAHKKEVDNKIEKYVLVEEPLVTTMLPLEKSGARSFLRSFKDSLNSREDVAQESNQSLKVNPRNPEKESESEELNQNGADSTTLEFCYEPTAADSRAMRDEDSEKPWKAEDVSNPNYRHITDPLAAHVVQSANMDERPEDYPLDSEFRNSNNPFLVGEIRSSGLDGITMDTHHETLPNNMEGRSSNPFAVDVESAIVEVSPNRSTNNPFVDCEVENSDMDKNSESIDQQPDLNNKIADNNNPFSLSNIHSSSLATGIQLSDEQPELSHKGNSYNPFTDSEIDKFVENTGTVTEGAPKNVSFTDQGGDGVGETSFSAVSGRITYSGPILFSGSTSLRSDSSTTSTRSFAFPVLQSEWNSSPVRMQRADRRQFRKQRGGWKHGILCCKF